MELKELMKEAGIVGAGGAGFPAYAKLAPGADILLVNGAECEPLLYTDYIILSREMPMVLAGIKAVLEYADIPRALLCVKADRQGIFRQSPELQTFQFRAQRVIASAHKLQYHNNDHGGRNQPHLSGDGADRETGQSAHHGRRYRL